MGLPTKLRLRKLGTGTRTSWVQRVLLVFGLLASASILNAQDSFKPITEQSIPVEEEGEATHDWYWWWYFNKDAYLELRKAIFESAPKTGGREFFIGNGVKTREVDPTKLTAYELRVLIVPSILKVLVEEDEQIEGQSDDLILASLMALSKIGQPGELSDGEPFDIVIGRFLDHTKGTIRDRAVVALGILGYEESVPLLIDLLKNSPAGRRIVDRAEVPRSMRAYAAFALAMIGSQSEDLEIRREIIAELADILVGPKFATRDIKAACMIAMGHLPLEIKPYFEPPVWRGGPRLKAPDPTTDRLAQIRFLLFYMGDRRANHDSIRSYIPTALMNLIEGADDETRIEVMGVLNRVLRKFTTEPIEIQQAAILTLGQLGHAGDDRLARKVIDTLMRYVKFADSQSNRYALIALGQIAARPGPGKEPWYNHENLYTYLRKQLEGRAESRMRAWAAISLGVMMRARLEMQLPIPERSLEALRKAHFDCRTPLDVGAYALALGLARDSESLEQLKKSLDYFEIDTARGLVLLSMGMIGNREASEPLMEELADIKFRGERMAFASIALALNGESDRVPLLLDLLEKAGSQESQGPIVTALGVSGDRRVISPLVEVVRDDVKYRDAVRAAAIVGLGTIGDRRSLLWRTQFSANTNYRFGTTTFFQPNAGLLSFY
ncbi:MAG: HEAT repeat protein [Planctomycetota bacterium]|jgi:HEAT repeat protein